MPRHPNILLITTHDSGRHFGCYGVNTVHTSRIDRLAGGGVLLAQCFGTAPICCASRAAMLTGAYPQTNGQMDLFFPPFNWSLREPRRHASHVFRDNGYHTCLLGLQHEVGNPEMLRFDERRMERPIPMATEVAAGVAEFLQERRNAAQPFFAQVGFFETHSPFDWNDCPADDSLGVTVPPQVSDSPTTRRVLASLQGALRRVDEAVGIIDDALQATGLADDTILIFTTDHGLEVPRAKWHLYDAGIGTAMILRWPTGGVGSGKTVPAVSDDLVSHIDLLPTLCELAGCEIPAWVQGRSFANALRGNVGVPHREAIHAMYQKSASRCVRTRRHKLIRHFGLATLGAMPSGWFMHYNPDAMDVQEQLRRRGIPDLYPNLELYDLEADPFELHNLAREPAQVSIIQDLEDRLWRWMEEVDDPLLRGPERTPFYEQSIDRYREWRQVRE